MAVSKENKPKRQKNPRQKKTHTKQSNVILTPAQLSNVKAIVARQHTLHQQYGKIANEMLSGLKQRIIVKEPTTREQSKPINSRLPGTDAFSPLVGHIKPDEFVFSPLNNTHLRLLSGEFVFSPLNNTHLRLLSVVEMLAEFKE